MQDDSDYTIYPIFINSSGLQRDSYNNRYSYTFPAGSVNFKKSKVAVANIGIYYSWFNITTVNNNNTFSIVWPTNVGSTTYNITLPDGFYDVSQLNSYLQQWSITNGLYLVDASGNYVYYVELIENPTYYSVQYISYPVPTALPAGYTNPAGMTFPAVASTPQIVIAASPSAFKDVIGFNNGTFPAAFQATTYSKLSDYTPQVSPIQSLVLSCELVNNKYSIPQSIIYTFSPAGTAFGSLIQSVPNEYFFVDIAEGNYNTFNIQFLDQNYNKVFIRDTNIIVQLLIKTKL